MCLFLVGFFFRERAHNKREKKRKRDEEKSKQLTKVRYEKKKTIMNGKKESR